jgi:hypothetical protein
VGVSLRKRFVLRRDVLRVRLCLAICTKSFVRFFDSLGGSCGRFLLVYASVLCVGRKCSKMARKYCKAINIPLLCFRSILGAGSITQVLCTR